MRARPLTLKHLSRDFPNAPKTDLVEVILDLKTKPLKQVTLIGNVKLKPTVSRTRYFVFR